MVFMELPVLLHTRCAHRGRIHSFRKDAYANAGVWIDSIHTEDNYNLLFNEVNWLPLRPGNGSTGRT